MLKLLLFVLYLYRDILLFFFFFFIFHDLFNDIMEMLIQHLCQCRTHRNVELQWKYLHVHESIFVLKIKFIQNFPKLNTYIVCIIFL